MSHVFLNAAGVKVKVNPEYLTDDELKNLKPFEPVAIPDVITAAKDETGVLVAEAKAAEAKAAEAKAAEAKAPVVKKPEVSDLD